MRRYSLWALALFLLAACGGPPERAKSSAPVPAGYKVGQPYKIDGRWYHPYFDPGYDETGIASWYGQAFQDRPTANGERFDKEAVSAAHPTMPLPSMVEVTNLENGRQITLRVNDRGPFVDDRLIDLSEAAARELGYRDSGLARVRVRFLRLAERGVSSPKPARPETVIASTVTAEPARRGKNCGGAYHFVQVGAYIDRSGAQAVASRLAQHGQVEIDQIRTKGRTLDRVRFGPLPTRVDAFTALASMYRLGYQDAIVVSC